MKRGFYAILGAALLMTACAKHAPMPVETTEEQTLTETEPASQEETQAAPLPEEQYDTFTPIDIDVYEEYISEWQDGKKIIEGSSSFLHVLSSGYEALQETLDQYGKANWEEVQAFYQDCFEDAQEMFDRYGFSELEMNRKVILERSDSKIVSFTNSEQSYWGGAHGSYIVTGENLDPATGEYLSLKDVVRDYDQVYQYTLNHLETEHDLEEFFPDYQETLQNMFYGSSDDSEESEALVLEWSMDREKVTLYFNRYLLGPYSSGMFTVEIPFSGQEQLVKEAYIPEKTGKVIKVWEENEVILEKDGQEVSLFYTAETREETLSNLITLRLGQETIEQEVYSEISETYVLQKSDGKMWLYMDCIGDNDWHTLHVFDLNGEAPFYVGTGGSYIGEHLISDVENFALYNHLDLLGTYEAFRHYRLGDDGLPQALEDVYTIVNYDRGYGEYAITSKVELTVQMHGEHQGERSEETLPAGTKYYLRKTDGETFVEMELEDKRRCDIMLERDEFFSKIQGMDEDDCFDGLRYAG